MIDEASLVQLEYFRAVARLGSLTRAAEALNVTQPTLSTAIARLERQYGVQLLARIHRKGVEPTLAGQRLLVVLEPLLDSASRLGSIARGTDEPLQGELSVGVYSPLAPFYSPTILLEASRLMPDVKVTLHDGNLEDLWGSLRRRQLDVALMYDDGSTGECGTTLLSNIDPHVVVSEEHWLVRAGRTSVSLHELAKEPAAFLSVSHSFNMYIGIFRSLGLAPHIKYTSPNYEVIRSYVASGLGYSLLHHQHLTRETHCGRRIVPLRIEEDLPVLRLCAVTPTQDLPPARTTSMIEVLSTLVERFSTQNPL